jgi:hypothetical protein
MVLPSSLDSAGDGRVRRRLARRLDDMAGAGAGGAGDDVQLLGGRGRADQDHGADALHRVVDAPLLWREEP